jgi:hypothetical protein
MRYLLAACFLGLGLGVALGLFLVTLGDALESFDPSEAPAFFRLAASGVRAIRSRVRVLVDSSTAACPEQSPTPTPRLSRDQFGHIRCTVC